MFSRFEKIPKAKDDPILGLPLLFKKDPRADKINLGIGTYMTADGKSYLFEAVRQAEKNITDHPSPKNYLPIEGDPFFLEQILLLNLGLNIDPKKTLAVQTIGGTGSLSLASEFIHEFISQEIAISDPSWTNHSNIFSSKKFHIHFYPYLNQAKCLENIPENGVVLLQSACHNPTGSDFSKEEWQKALKIIKKKNLFPLFDNAYQGFGASVEEDAYPLRLFYEHNIEMIISTAYSKNFGLYGERIGALIFSFNSPEKKEAILTQIRKIIRIHYSSPSIHGAKIVAEILSNPKLKALWEKELSALKERILQMRSLFAKKLIEKTKDSSLNYLFEDKGFFSLLPLTEEEVLSLRKDKGIYMPLNGRINLAGLTLANIDQVVNGIYEIKK